jgi:hypothetical protein
MAMMPPAIGSPPSLLIGEEPGEKRCVATLITPTHDVYEALRRQRAGEEKWWVAARVPPEKHKNPITSPSKWNYYSQVTWII